MSAIPAQEELTLLPYKSEPFLDMNLSFARCMPHELNMQFAKDSCMSGKGSGLTVLSSQRLGHARPATGPWPGRIASCSIQHTAATDMLATSHTAIPLRPSLTPQPGVGP